MTEENSESTGDTGSGDPEPNTDTAPNTDGPSTGGGLQVPNEGVTPDETDEATNSESLDDPSTPSEPQVGQEYTGSSGTVF